jgi:hypothetical protein
MGTVGLDRALARGAPLVEIHVRFRSDVDAVSATEAFNSLGDDIDLYARPWDNALQKRHGSSTKEALARLFGWNLARVPLERYDEATGEWGTWPNTFRWKEINKPQFFPPVVADLIESIGFVDPGADDDGQWCE